MSLENIVQQIDREIANLTRARKALAGLEGKSVLLPSGGAGKRAFTASSRAKMAAAQKARWAKFRAAKRKNPVRTRPDAARSVRIVSPAARKKMAAAQKARWAKVRSEKKQVGSKRV